MISAHKKQCVAQKHVGIETIRKVLVEKHVDLDTFSTLGKASVPTFSYCEGLFKLTQTI